MRIPLAAFLVFALLSPFQFAVSQVDPVFDKSEVKEFRFTFSDPDWWRDLQGSGRTGIDVESDLFFEGRIYPSVGIRVKGNTSATVFSDKKPFNVSIDSFIPGQRLEGYKTINLNNGFVDPTFTREILTYELYRRFMPTLKTGYARVYFNDEYWGLYITIEQPNKEFIEDDYADEDGVRYKGDDPNNIRLNSSTLQWFGADESNYYDKYEIKTPDHPEAWTSLVHLIDKLNNTSPADFEEEIEQVLDVDRALWYLAASNVVHNLDSYLGGGHNYYMYFDPWDGRMDMISWDCNLSFGAFTGGPNAYRLRPDYRKNSVSRPLFRKLYEVPQYQADYLAHIRTILDEFYDWANHFGPLNDQYQNLIRADVTADPNRLYSMADFDNGVTTDKSYDGFFAPGLQPLVERRRQYLMNHPLVGLPSPLIEDVRFDPSDRVRGESLAVTARVTWRNDHRQAPPSSRLPHKVELKTSFRGAFRSIEMLDDGMHLDGPAGDGVYGAVATIEEPAGTLRFYVRAKDLSGVVATHPARAEYEFHSLQVLFGAPSGPIALNELVADNENGDEDENGDNEDWVEIVNSSSVPVDLSGYFLTDNFELRKKWEFPTGSVIPANGFLRVWCDDEDDGPWHASFKLSRDGEEVALLDSDGGLVDAVVFGPLGEDEAFGRIADYGDHWFHIDDPSGEAPNLEPPNLAVRYDQRTQPAFDLRFAGGHRVGDNASLLIERGPANQLAFVAIGLAPQRLEAAGIGPISVDLSGALLLTVPLNGAGQATLPFQVTPPLADQTLFVQALSITTSNALALRFLP